MLGILLAKLVKNENSCFTSRVRLDNHWLYRRKMNQNIYIFSLSMLLFAPAIFALFGYISRWTLRSYFLEMDDLSKHFPGSRSNSKIFFPQPQFVGHFSGFKFSVTYVTGNKGISVYGLSSACYFPSTSKMKIYVYDKKPGPVLFAKKINTGDSDLEKYFIYSNNHEEAMRYLSIPARRKSIQQIIGKWQMLKISGKSIYTYADIETAPSLDLELLRATLTDLIDLRIDRI